MKIKIPGAPANSFVAFVDFNTKSNLLENVQHYDFITFDM